MKGEILRLDSSLSQIAEIKCIIEGLVEEH